MEPGASVLPIDRVDDPEAERINLHTWAYYEIDHGGWSPYVHAWQGRHPIYLRRRLWAPPEAEDDERQRLPEAVVERVAACYDYVVLWDASDDGAAEFSRDFELANAAPRLHVWRNRAGVRRRIPSSVPGCTDDDAEATHS
jgi:hypothetical protein